MTTIQLEIRPDVVVVRIPVKNFATTIPNEITVRDRKIIGQGRQRVGYALITETMICSSRALARPSTTPAESSSASASSR